MTGFTHREFYDNFLSQGYVCFLIEKVCISKAGTYIKGIASHNHYLGSKNLQFFSKEGKLLAFSNQICTVTTHAASLYLSKKENRFVDLSKETVPFNRTEFEIEFPVREGSIILQNVFLENICEGCVLLDNSNFM